MSNHEEFLLFLPDFECGIPPSIFFPIHIMKKSCLISYADFMIHEQLQMENGFRAEILEWRNSI